MAAGEIDDRQAALAEGRAVAEIGAVVVRTAMPQRVEGARERLAGVSSSADQAGNSAHGSGSPVPLRV